MALSIFLKAGWRSDLTNYTKIFPRNQWVRKIWRNKKKWMDQEAESYLREKQKWQPCNIRVVTEVARDPELVVGAVRLTRRKTPEVP